MEPLERMEMVMSEFELLEERDAKITRIMLKVDILVDLEVALTKDMLKGEPVDMEDRRNTIILHTRTIWDALEKL